MGLQESAMCANLNIVMPDGTLPPEQSLEERLQRLIADARTRPAPAAAPAGADDTFEKRLASEMARAPGATSARPIPPARSAVSDLRRTAPPPVVADAALPPDLAYVMKAWPDLTPLMRSQILALVRSAECMRKAT